MIFQKGSLNIVRGASRLLSLNAHRDASFSLADRSSTCYEALIAKLSKAGKDREARKCYEALIAKLSKAGKDREARTCYEALIAKLSKAGKDREVRTCFEALIAKLSKAGKDREAIAFLFFPAFDNLAMRAS
jgi:acetyl/propionyl-CoA carboxylase alpha subunit